MISKHKIKLIVHAMGTRRNGPYFVHLLQFLLENAIHFYCTSKTWVEALEAGDPESVFVLAQPLKIPRHNFYEFVWLLKTGLPRYVST